MDKDYPFATEYAKSGRASCKSCKLNISKDSLRMANMTQSHHFDGKIPNWFHFDCFFKKMKIRNLEDIKNFDTLRWDDQEKIKKKITAGDEPIDFTSSQFSLEYSKTNRSKCVKCEQKIEKTEIRFSQQPENKSDTSKKTGAMKQWYHINCLTTMTAEIVTQVPDFNIEKIEGFPALNEADKKELLERFKSSKSKKRSKKNKDSDGGPTKKKSKSEDEAHIKLKEQNQRIWDLRDKLSKDISKNALVSILTHNKQFIPKGESNILDAVTDCMLFGCLSPCPECGGLLSFSSNIYKCRSMLNEWVKCVYQSRTVVREPFVIPEEYGDIEIFGEYQYEPNPRILPNETCTIEAFEPLKGYSVTIDRIPLDNGYTQSKAAERIRKLGGEVLKTITSLTMVLISSKEDQDGKSSSLKSQAKSKSVDVVSVQFMDGVENDKEQNIIETIKKYSIVNWGRSRQDLAGLKTANQKALEKKFVNKEKSDMQTITVKGGAAVDPDSGLEDKAHLYQDPLTRDPLNAILGMADLSRGSNSYYKLQLLESDTKRKWWVFRAWGRIGTVIGSTKLDKFDDLQEAIDNFRAVYLDKTGNDWKNRNSFQKQPNKFSPIDVDYGSEAKDMNLTVEESASQLQLALQDLIRFIFDMDSMKKAMLEFEIDMNRMPLGKLSKKQIDISYGILKELQDILTESGASKNKLLELSNRFYTMMPHNFGIRTPPLIDSLGLVKEKCDMIESLMEMEVAYKLMKGESDSDGPTIDSRYAKLHNRMAPLDRNSEEFQRLETYLQNTHAPTHRDYKIKILEIYDVARDGEKDRFHAFKKLPNRMMLWHGSRRTNWAGILSQGLRIAPPEAPITGYMFGKGIYFADMVSKSANYCHTSESSPDGLLLLCEVALGTMSERLKADQNIVLKKGEHSCKGCGVTVCDPAGNYTDSDGVVYPMGKPIQLKVKSSLLYNEYIVYDIGQVRQRYLFRVQFDYRR